MHKERKIHLLSLRRMPLLFLLILLILRRSAFFIEQLSVSLVYGQDDVDDDEYGDEDLSLE